MSAITTLCKTIRIACEASEIVNDTAQAISNQNGSGRDVSTALTVVKICSLVINCTEFGAQLRGASNATLKNIKGVEVASRIVSGGFTLAQTSIEAEAEGDIGWNHFEKGFLAPIAAIGRSLNEEAIYREKAYLDMTPEELSRERRAVCDGEGTAVTTRPVVREECEAILQDAKKADPVLNAAEAFFKIGATTRIVGNLTKAYEKLAQRLQQAVPVAVPAVPPRPIAVANEPVSVFNLVALPLIPEELHDDLIFRRYICPITVQPIRHPVALPGEPHLFERGPLSIWIIERGTSPTNRRPIELHQMIAKPAIQALINHRLLFHQNRLIQHVQQGLAIAADHALVQAAEAEE